MDCYILVQPTNTEFWISSEIFPHFCNISRWIEIESEDLNYQMEEKEYLWTHKNLREYGPDLAPPLCILSIPFLYDLFKEYEDAESKEYDRFCIEELGFEIIEFDEDGWTNLTMLCETSVADTIVRKLKKKMKELNFDADVVKYFFDNRVIRCEQIKCPRCNHLCSIGVTYCPECSLVVGIEFIDWSEVKYEKPYKNKVKEVTPVVTSRNTPKLSPN